MRITSYPGIIRLQHELANFDRKRIKLETEINRALAEIERLVEKVIRVGLKLGELQLTQQGLRQPIAEILHVCAARASNIDHFATDADGVKGQRVCSRIEGEVGLRAVKFYRSRRLGRLQRTCAEIKRPKKRTGQAVFIQR